MCLVSHSNFRKALMQATCIARLLKLGPDPAYLLCVYTKHFSCLCGGTQHGLILAAAPMGLWHMASHHLQLVNAANTNNAYIWTKAVDHCLAAPPFCMAHMRLSHDAIMRDATLVRNAFQELAPHKVIPCFGVHPWFAHLHATACNQARQLAPGLGRACVVLQCINLCGSSQLN